MKNSFIFISLALISLMASCQPKPKPPKTKAYINLVSDPRTLDPRKSRDLAERTLMNMLFEGLTRENKEGKTELALASSFEISEDKTCYTFHLKEALWSNGDKITAKDFVYAWKTALDPSFLSENAYQLFCIKNAEAIKKGEKQASELGAIALNETTLQITLDHPVPYLLELLSFSIFFPVHEAMDLQNWDLHRTGLISSGPFCLKEWKHTDFIDTVKNEKYWDAQSVHLQGVHLLMVTEETEMRMFEKKELDWAGSPLSSVSFDSVEGFVKKNQLYQHPLLATFFLRVNIESPPFNNVNIRKAFALAINRKALVEHVTKAGYKPARGLVPESMGIDTSSYFQDESDDVAKALFQKGLDEIGLKKEDFPKVTLLYASLQQNHVISQALQQDWNRTFGISVAVEPNERKVYFQRIGHQDYQIACGSWFADFNDPVNFLSVFKYKNTSTNNTQWENKEYVDLLDASEIASQDQRMSLLKKCEEILMEEMPVIPIYHHQMRYVKQENLKDVAVSSLGNLDFKWAYLDNPK